MALLFDLDEASEAQRLIDEATARRAVADAVSYARRVGGKAGLGLLADYRRQIVGAESQVLDEYITSDGNTRHAERLLNDGKTSKREQRRKAKRAKTVGQNKKLADKLGSGEMSEEQVDVIAEAADKTGGAAAVDDDFIDSVADVSPEQGKALADDFVAAKATADGVQTEHDRQRALRRASNYHNKKSGLAALTLEGDSVSIKAMWDAIINRADALYQHDGDRDLPHDQHPRTSDQRRFDAAHQILTGTNLKAKNPKTTGVKGNGVKAKSATGSGQKGSSRFTPKARPRIIIGLTLDKFLGRDPAAVATQFGLGLIPDSVLAEYAADADIMAALFGRNGETLWLGRLRRYASATQMIALVLRDKHCVLCGADHNQCEAHHTMPWNAPGKGRTDLDDLVLLCTSCHTRLHADQHTIYQDLKGHWRTRPATPDETPPPRPTPTSNTATRNTPRRE